MHDGTVVLYPMHAENRRRERRREVVDAVGAQTGYKISRVVDLSHHEAAGPVPRRHGQPGAGSRESRGLCESFAAHAPAVVEEWARRLGYEPVMFSAMDRAARPIYHTNVLMCIGERFAVVGTEAIARSRSRARAGAASRERPRDRRDRPRRNRAVRRQHAGARDLGRGARRLPGARDVRQRRAWRCSRMRSRRLSACTDSMLAVPVPTIEKLSGGSVRCMLAEIFICTLVIELIAQSAGELSARLAHRRLVVGRLRGGVDIRTLGSGNAGGTNALRTQGKSFALWVMLIDIGKGIVATRVIAPLSLPASACEPPAMWREWLP